jgi:hypothetical protein
MSIASRIPGFLLLGIVIVAAVLLVAGYGVPVGVGSSPACSWVSRHSWRS